MSNTLRLRHATLSYGLLGTAVGCLLLAQRWERLAPEEPVPGMGWLAFLALTCAAAGLHRPLRGNTLGLGALAQPLMLAHFGTVPAAWVTAGSLVLVGFARRHLDTRTPQTQAERRHHLRIFETAARFSLAVLASGVTWSLGSDLAAAGRIAVAAATYLSVSLLLDSAYRRVTRPGSKGGTVAFVLPLSIDLLGWLVGAALLTVVAEVGWPTASLLLASLTLLSLEATRNALKGENLDRQLDDLGRVRSAQRRMIASSRENETLADQVRVECSNVVPYSWFQFELSDSKAGYQSWYARRSGSLQAGRPNPGKSAPPLPGIHRRSPWKLIERDLRTQDQTLARLRLWCDPRDLDDQAVELLDMLLPQMAASVERSILDREAKNDPLTGIAVRRVLERRLQAAYHRSYEDGSSVAVVLCDLDHFKKINDTYGHGAGDQALVQVARLLEKSGRGPDLCCRYGGEEFAILLEKTEGPEALVVADRLRQQVEELQLVYEGQRINLTLSAGAAAFPELYVKTASELLLLADTALYAAKATGRNRCLLNLGRGCYRGADGEVIRGERSLPNE